MNSRVGQGHYPVHPQQHTAQIAGTFNRSGRHAIAGLAMHLADDRAHDRPIPIRFSATRAA
ncbi:MAG: hypothetical protein KatS3mg053_3353 [Candidatus Roseilinea sp.]|nr:MAG: hypothetical protein KatS3mg053_3353 [Candidatus Roseilinea sp.]